jgi:hypothetical protein
MDHSITRRNDRAREQIVSQEGTKPAYVNEAKCSCQEANERHLQYHDRSDSLLFNNGTGCHLLVVVPVPD